MLRCLPLSGFLKNRRCASSLKRDKLQLKMLNFSSKHCQKKLQLLAAPLLSTVVIIGALLRFWNLGEWSFWKDEVFMVLDAQQFTLGNSPINPIPYLAVKLSIVLAGDSEWGSRLIPCMVGILSIPVIFGLGRTLFNGRVGLLAAALVALSSWHLFWTQNARCSYIWTFLFAALTAWLFYLSVERHSTLLTLGALLTCICLILSHLLAAFMVPALAVYAVLSRRSRLDSRKTRHRSHRDQEVSPTQSRLDSRKTSLNLLLFFAPFAIPVLALAHPKIHGYLFSGWGLNEWSRSPLYIVLTLVQGVSVPVAVAAFFGGVVGCGGCRDRGESPTGKNRDQEGAPTERNRDQEVSPTGISGQEGPRTVNDFFRGVAALSHRPTRFLVCYAGVPLLLFLIAAQFQNVAGYYLFWTTPAYFLLAAVACERLYTKLGSTFLSALLPCILMMNLAAHVYLYFNLENGGRPRWRETFDVIRTHQMPTDKMVISEPEMGTYYLPELEAIHISEILEDVEAFEKRWVSSEHRLWFVVDAGSFNVFDAKKKVREWIQQRGRIVHTFATFSRAKDRTIHLYLLE